VGPKSSLITRSPIIISLEAPNIDSFFDYSGQRYSDKIERFLYDV
jgi:hypothetical protein